MLTGFASELEKIAAVDDKQKALGIAGAASSVGLAGSYVGRGAADVAVPKGPVTVYYTDPRRGAGHKVQAQALVGALRKQGQQVREPVNIETAFGDPKKFDVFLRTYKARLAGKKTFNQELIKRIAFYRTVMNDPKFKQAMTRGDRVVLTNVSLQAWVTKFKTPAFVLHTDPAPWAVAEYAQRGTRAHQHIVPAAAAKELRSRHKSMNARMSVIPDVPIKPVGKMVKNALRAPGVFNITVSGGGLGYNTTWMADELLRSGLPDGTVIHAVAGRSKDRLSELRALEKATAGKAVQVRAYGFSPLYSMMAQADMNVLRPHGTSIAEATSVGKPFAIYLPSRSKDQGMVVRNAMATYRHTGQPIAYRGHLGKTVRNVMQNYESYAAKVRPLAASAGRGAEEAASAISKQKTFKAFKRSGVKWTARRVALGTAAVGSVGALALLRATKKSGHWRKLPPTHKGQTEHGAPIAGKTWVRSKQKPHSGVAKRR